jgi:hypothetical protein
MPSELYAQNMLHVSEVAEIRKKTSFDTWVKKTWK